MTDATQEPETYSFARGGEQEGFVANYATDETISTLAVCIAHQQAAGFKLHLDLRAVACPACGAMGFNTGWGAWRMACGAEVLSDGTPGDPCPKASSQTDDTPQALASQDHPQEKNGG